jgi:chromosome segregation ATPase
LVDETHAEADAIKSKIEALKKYQATTEAYEAVGGDKRKAGGGKAELAGLNLPADRKAAALAAPDLDLKNAEAVAATIARLNEEYSQVSKTITDVESTQRRYIKQLNEANNAETVASAKVDSLNSSVEGLNKKFEDSKAKNLQSAYTTLRSAAEKLGIELSDIPVDYTEQNFKELEAAMVQLTTNGIA